MPHVVTQSCCSDASCVYACPVNCIHPTPDEPDFATAEMLHIDPATCVDCGACVGACPVDAIKPQDRLSVAELPFVGLNADYYREHNAPHRYPALAPLIPTMPARADREPLRVAIVGSGPAAMYAADELLKRPGARVNVFERLSQPYGLARTGVAPDHQRTRRISELFAVITREPGIELFVDAEVGGPIRHEDLRAHHHAVIYALGAASDRRLDIPGADLPGVASATEFVGWYNGHPDHIHRHFDLSSRRVVLIGNGNVALDVARILLTDPERLEHTAISRDALATLRKSAVEEVVLVGRRGPEHSAFTMPEFTGLIGADDFDVVVRHSDFRKRSDFSNFADPDPATTSHPQHQKLAVLRHLGDAADVPAKRRVVLRYGLPPSAVCGNDAVSAVEFGSVRIETGLLLTSIGYRGTPTPALPYDPATGVVPNRAGRVDGVASTYVVGWCKRGPSGFIGTNKSCAHETVENLVADFNAGLLPSPTAGPRAVHKLVDGHRRPQRIRLLDRR